MLPEVRRWAQRAVVDRRSLQPRLGSTGVCRVRSAPRRVHATRWCSGCGPRLAISRDAFAANGVGIALWGSSSTLAYAATQQAARIDPLYLYPPLNNAEPLVYLGKTDEALAVAETVLRLEPRHAGRPRQEGAHVHRSRQARREPQRWCLHCSN